ncbi:hypothetical protein SEUCBS139899_003951, partial [Sporothrix eucalyptigena]
MPYAHETPPALPKLEDVPPITPAEDATADQIQIARETYEAELHAALIEYESALALFETQFDLYEQYMVVANLVRSRIFETAVAPGMGERLLELPDRTVRGELAFLYGVYVEEGEITENDDSPAEDNLAVAGEQAHESLPARPVQPARPAKTT